MNNPTQPTPPPPPPHPPPSQPTNRPTEMFEISFQSTNWIRDNIWQQNIISQNIHYEARDTVLFFQVGDEKLIQKHAKFQHPQIG